MEPQHIHVYASIYLQGNNLETEVINHKMSKKSVTVAFGEGFVEYEYW